VAAESVGERQHVGDHTEEAMAWHIHVVAATIMTLYHIDADNMGVVDPYTAQA